MDYLAFFKFNDPPFRLTPDRDFFFRSTNHNSVEKVVQFGIEEGEGFIIVVGEVGTGKTMVLRWVAAHLSEKYETAVILSPQLSPRELVQAILRDIGQYRTIDEEAGLDVLLHTLNNHLYNLSRDGRRLIIIIDEAHDLTDESIEQLRLLSNFESDKHKWLQIILFGQPELRQKMEQTKLRQLLQRVTIMETLVPLSRHEMRQYIHFRLARAGRGDLRLPKRSINAAWNYSRGVPRLINKLMSRSLLVASADLSENVSVKHIRTAAESLEMRRPFIALPWPFRRTFTP